MICFDYDYENVPDSSIDERFKIIFKPTQRTFLSWKEELNLSAKHIMETIKKPIYVLMSGGIDSEIVARTFLEAGVDFKVLTLKYKNGKNTKDKIFAEWFCKSNKIEQKIVELDSEQFFTQGFEKYVGEGYRSTNLYHYQQLFLLEILEDLGGFGVTGDGDQTYYTINDKIHLKFNPSFKLWIDWCRNNNTEHQFRFLSSSPEMCASYMKIDLIEFLLNRPEYFINHHYNSTEKILAYHRYWPDMTKRNKSDGFEYISDSIRLPKEKELKSRFPDIQDLYLPIELVKHQLKI